MAYDEQAILTDYVWSHCTHLMSQFDQVGLKAANARFKAENSSPEMAKKILARWGAENNPEVTEALERGGDEFREAVRDRVLRDHPEVINRCPCCKKVVRTPKAKQCRWCQHDWH